MPASPRVKRGRGLGQTSTSSCGTRGRRWSINGRDLQGTRAHARVNPLDSAARGVLAGFIGAVTCSLPWTRVLEALEGCRYRHTPLPADART